MAESIDKRSLDLVRHFAPDLNKAMNRDIDKLLGEVVNRARGFVATVKTPMSGWTVAKQGNGTWADKVFDVPTIQKGISKTRNARSRYIRGAYQSGFAITNNTAAGIIYEGAGQEKGKQGKSTNPNAGAQFMFNIAERSQIPAPKHRMIVAILIEMRPDIRSKIDHVIDDAIRQFNAVMK
jgi:hypothetical protein